MMPVNKQSKQSKQSKQRRENRTNRIEQNRLEQIRTERKRSDHTRTKQNKEISRLNLKEVGSQSKQPSLRRYEQEDGAKVSVELSPQFPGGDYPRNGTCKDHHKTFANHSKSDSRGLAQPLFIPESNKRSIPPAAYFFLPHPSLSLENEKTEGVAPTFK